MDPVLSTLTIDAREVAGLLGIAETTFRNKRARLEIEDHFPPKLPGGNRWSRPAVVRWIETNGESYAIGGEASTISLSVDPSENLEKRWRR